MKSKLLIVILAVVFLAGGGGAYYFLVLNKEGSAVSKKSNAGHEDESDGEEMHTSTDEHGDAEEEEEEEEHSGGHGGHGGNSGPQIEPFVVNLADPGSRRYLRVSIKLSLKNPKENESLLEMRMPQVRDTVLLLLSSKTADQLLGSEGKRELRQELIDQINKVLKKGKQKKIVRNLYFTEFLIQ